MIFRRFQFLMVGIAFAGVCIAASAQQGSGATPPVGSPGSSGQSDSTPSNPPSSQNAKKTPPQPLKPATPDELRFPGDDPAQPAPPSSSSAPSSSTTPSPDQPRTLTPPRSDSVQVQDLGPAAGESSSKEAPVDLNAPDDDAKQHPQSSEVVTNAEADSLSSGGITDLRTWDPHKAAKDVEVGDFYFKRQNYRAAEARYRDALRYKDDDAVATIKLAVCLEKLGILDDARAEYESYLRILPHGPQAGEAQKGIARLKAETAAK
jgi:hypothetical protein